MLSHRSARRLFCLNKPHPSSDFWCGPGSGPPHLWSIRCLPALEPAFAFVRTLYCSVRAWASVEMVRPRSATLTGFNPDAPRAPNPDRRTNYDAAGSVRRHAHLA